MCDTLLGDDFIFFIDGQLVLAAYWIYFGPRDGLNTLNWDGDCVAQLNILLYEFCDMGPLLV